MSYSLWPSSGGGAISRTPIDGSEANAIAAWPGDSATGVGPSNFVLDQDTVVFRTHYDGTANGAFDISTTQLLGTTEGAASSAAFQIPVATDITLAGLFLVSAGTEGTPYLIVNSTTLTNISYAIIGQTNNLKWQTSAALVDSTERLPGAAWIHVAATSASSRTLTKFYINGNQYGSDLVTTATTPHADSELYIGNVANQVAGDVVGGVSDILIADTDYSAAAIKTLAENAFGHVLA